MLIPIFNPDTTDYEKSYLTKSYTAGVTSIEVKNNERFAANDRIMIGEMGTEQAEIVTVSAVGSDDVTLTVGATQLPHTQDDPVTVMQFDQIKVYRATSENGTYSVLATIAIDVDNATLQTVYDDTTGTASNWYKISFYHSVDAVESSLSDPIPGGGWKRNQVGYIIDDVLREVGDLAEQFVSRDELVGYFNDVNDDLLTQAAKPYVFLHTREAFSRTANQNYLDFPTDSNGDQKMWKFDRMDYNFTDTSTDPDTDVTTTIPVVEAAYFRNKYADNTINSTTVSDAVPEAMTLDVSVNRFRFSHPFKTTKANAFYLHYWKYFNRIDSEGDEIETPTPRVYKLYLKALYYRKRAVSEPSYSPISDRYFADYAAEKARYNSHNQKDRGTPKAFSLPGRTVKGFRLK